MAYKPLRERFPQLGSQMACNVIYSVSRAARRVYQHPDSPYNVARHADQPLPLLRFGGPVPVYFDRHTLSLKAGEVSLFTLDGRMRFKVDLSPETERRFRQDKLREIVLAQLPDGAWALTFDFTPADESTPTRTDPDWPQYLVVSSAAFHMNLPANATARAAMPAGQLPAAPSAPTASAQARHGEPGAKPTAPALPTAPQRFVKASVWVAAAARCIAGPSA